MKAMILAAGRGERMRPLTDHIPKPLLTVAGKPLIAHTIEQLIAGGFTDIVINHAHLGQQIEKQLGNGQQFGANIAYSPEGDEALETAGGIIHALPLLGDKPFLVVNGDIATNFPYADLHEVSVALAHIVLIDNPDHNPQGDFGLANHNFVTNDGQPRYTFSGIGIYHPDLFKDTAPGKNKLAPLLRKAIAAEKVTGQYFGDFWMDIGTPERLQALEKHLTT